VHMPDGYMNLATAVGGAAVAGLGIWASLKQTGRRLADRQVPMAGLTAAFVFAAQVLNSRLRPEPAVTSSGEPWRPSCSDRGWGRWW